MTQNLTFQNHILTVVHHDGGIWFTSADLSRALGYSNTRSVGMIYDRNQDEFTPEMSDVLNLSTSGNLQTTTRIFSLRGAHLVAMFARTKVAKEFRRWVLDILDQQTKAKPQAWIVAPGQTPIPLSDKVILDRDAVQGVMAAVEMVNDICRNYFAAALKDSSHNHTPSPDTLTTLAIP